MMLEQITRRLEARLALRKAAERQALLLKKEQARAKPKTPQVDLAVAIQDITLENEAVEVPPTPVEEPKAIVIGVRVSVATHDRLGRVKNTDLAKLAFGKPTLQIMAREAIALGVASLQDTPNEVIGPLTSDAESKVIVIGVRVPIKIHERLGQVKQARQGKPSYQALALEALILGIDALEAKYV